MNWERCPRCGGLLYLDEDKYERYLTCIMCAREFERSPKKLKKVFKVLKEVFHGERNQNCGTGIY